MKRNTAAFTLVEVLTGIIIFALISTCSWFAVSTLFRGEQLTSNRTIAINLLQKSQEELRRASLTFYDTLETCQFPGPSVVGSCGLQPLGSNFANYTRSVTTSLVSGSTEIKQAIITVTWKDQGRTLSMSSAVLLARPPDALPGNVIGTVRSSGSGNPLISGVTIKLTKDKLEPIAVSKGTLEKSKSGVEVNFNFSDTSTKAFNLPVGSWKLKATHPSYFDYTHPMDIIVSPNSELPQIDFMMEPKPLDATIKIQLINGLTKAPLINFYNGSYYILDDYKEKSKVIASANNSTGGDFTIKFTDTNPQNFTVNTYYAYRNGYAGNPSCTGFPNNYHGWSSAVVMPDNTTTTCANPYNGSKVSDRITVNPGDNITVEAPLFPVPTATIKGKVINETTKEPLAGAKVYAQWPWGDKWIKDGVEQFTFSDSEGKYSFVVPAVQTMTNLKLSIQAIKSMPTKGCCESSTSVDRSSPWVAVGGLGEGSIVEDIDLKIKSADPFDCGNVKGTITNGLSGSAIPLANVSVQSQTTTTETTGDYIYQCPSVGYRLPVGKANFFSWKDTFYDYDSRGNKWYNPVAGVNIKSKETVDYPAKLWPVGRGKIIATVVDSGTKFPIAGARVKFINYQGEEKNIITSSDGIATFNTVLETWPPPDLPADLYYNHTKRTHSLSVTDPSGFYAGVSMVIDSLQRDQTLTKTIELDGKGGT